MKYFIIISTLFLFVSCIKKYDTTLPNGYPFDKNIQELNIIENSSSKFKNTNAVIESYDSCVTYKLSNFDTTNCPCKNFDFSKNVMFLEFHLMVGVYSTKFYPKGYINYRNKTFGVNVRKTYEIARNCGLSSCYQNFAYTKLIFLPKFEGFKPVLDVEL